jgi:hypothetical protein
MSGARGSHGSDEELWQNFSREAWSEKIWLGLSSYNLTAPCYNSNIYIFSLIIHVSYLTKIGYWKKLRILFASLTAISYFVHKCLLQMSCAETYLWRLYEFITAVVKYG